VLRLLDPPAAGGLTVSRQTRPALRVPLRDHPAVRLLPIVFFEAYLAGTVLLFAFGPWPFPVQDGTKLYAFLALAHLALLFGYLRGIRRPGRVYTGKVPVARLALISLIVTAVLFVPTVSFRTGSLLPNVAAGVSDAGAVYEESNLMRQTGLPLIEYIRFVVAVPLFLLLPLTVFYWNRLSRPLRVASLVCLLGIPMTFVAMGTNKAIADIAILLPWLLFASYLAGNLKTSVIRATIAVTISACLLGVFVVFFALTQVSRSGSGSRFGYFPHIRARADYTNPLLRGWSPEIQTGVLGLVTYLSQGYYGLYLSLDKPAGFSYGVGHSMFLYRQAARLPGMAWIADTPYPVRIEEDGWSTYGLFASIYPWLASDATFPGTLILIFVIGRCLAVTWSETLLGDNPFAVAMFAQFLIMVYYFPANNQCFQSGESFSAFWGTCVMWLLTRSRLREARASTTVAA
jgi:hypothetical protein